MLCNFLSYFLLAISGQEVYADNGRSDASHGRVWCHSEEASLLPVNIQPLKTTVEIGNALHGARIAYHCAIESQCTIVECLSPMQEGLGFEPHKSKAIRFLMRRSNYFGW
jgi:hypothetical protein